MTALTEQRETLRLHLHAQRRRIEMQLSPHNGHGYPRSMTMRFLTQQPALAAKFFVGLATLLMGARFLKSVTTAVTVAQLVRSAANAASSHPAENLPAPDMDLAL